MRARAGRVSSPRASSWTETEKAYSLARGAGMLYFTRIRGMFLSAKKKSPAPQVVRPPRRLYPWTDMVVEAEERAGRLSQEPRR